MTVVTQDRWWGKCKAAERQREEGGGWGGGGGAFVCCVWRGTGGLRARIVGATGFTRMVEWEGDEKARGRRFDARQAGPGRRPRK